MKLYLKLNGFTNHYISSTLLMSSGTLLYSGHPEICFMPSHQSINKTCNKMKKLYDLEFLLIETSFSKSLIPNE